MQSTQSLLRNAEVAVTRMPTLESMQQGVSMRIQRETGSNKCVNIKTSGCQGHIKRPPLTEYQFCALHDTFHLIYDSQRTGMIRSNASGMKSSTRYGIFPASEVFKSAKNFSDTVVCLPTMPFFSAFLMIPPYLGLKQKIWKNRRSV